ncbi:hypothetical protein MMC25_001767 [Agyrium rufum]|nr:hypothetical protein [Agyrium rufum]
MYWPVNAPRVYTAVKRRKRQANNASTESSSAQLADDKIIDVQVTRNGHLFATISRTALTIWQTAPVAALTSVVRSTSSIETYGDNIAVLLRPDSSVAILRTSNAYLLTYTVTVDPEARVYQQIRTDQSSSRRQSAAGFPQDAEERMGLREVHLKFKQPIKIDAGIAKALALEDDLLVATEKPAAIQCIRWSTGGGTQGAGATASTQHTTTELLYKMPWLQRKTGIKEIVYDRAMSLFIYITVDGEAYAVQRVAENKDPTGRRVFRGYSFHTRTESKDLWAITGAVNARFSLLAIGCANGEVHVYTARDYAGNIPLSLRLSPPASPLTTGSITCMTYSPDGYCLFVGYEKGWCIWSVYGKQGGHSFNAVSSISHDNGEGWLQSVTSAHWISGGSEVLMSSKGSDCLWTLEFAKSALASCFTPANIFRTVLYTPTMLMIYRGHDLKNLLSVSTDPSLWLQVPIPMNYVLSQRPIRSVVVSPDGRYVAVAGRRGLAHYSVFSGRWKTFDDPDVESSIVVRGGMCWHQHILVVSVETSEQHELRLYSRELGLDDSSLLHIEVLPSAPVLITPTGDESILVFTYDNVLNHYIIVASNQSVQLVQVGQIGLHGIVRAPARVRAITWFIPDYQRRMCGKSKIIIDKTAVDGDPSQDVAHAAVIFLVDAKLVLLQPSQDENGAPKYDMRIVASNVEYFSFSPDDQRQKAIDEEGEARPIEITGSETSRGEVNLRNSLWYFDGQNIRGWTDIQDLLKPDGQSEHKDLPTPFSIPTDFSPTSISLSKGLITGLESDLSQRKDVQFATFRFNLRTQLFLPIILQHFLSHRDSSAALSLSCHYQHLPYFSHSLEILLHTVLDTEADMSPAPTAETALLPTVVSFLSQFPDLFLDIIVQCTRKTEVRSWRTLFANLPPPQELFEESLQQGKLKTAGGYLLVLHEFEEGQTNQQEGEEERDLGKYSYSSEQAVRLMRLAKEKGDWDLCKELARFLMALDESGRQLRNAMRSIGMPVGDESQQEDEHEGSLGGDLAGSDDGRKALTRETISTTQGSALAVCTPVRRPPSLSTSAESRERPRSGQSPVVSPMDSRSSGD